MSTNLIIALIAICLFFSALLSGSETAITYVPREKIHQLSDSKRNNKIKKAKDDLEQTIGGILVANNFVNNPNKRRAKDFYFYDQIKELSISDAALFQMGWDAFDTSISKKNS